MDSLVPKIVLLFVNGPLPVQVADWSLQLIEKASNVKDVWLIIFTIISNPVYKNQNIAFHRDFSFSYL